MNYKNTKPSIITVLFNGSSVTVNCYSYSVQNNQGEMHFVDMQDATKVYNMLATKNWCNQGISWTSNNTGYKGMLYRVMFTVLEPWLEFSITEV